MRNNTEWIQTFTGKKFWAFDPLPNDVDIIDIAHALAMKCRYGGHCREFYSVAQHSCSMAQIIYAGPQRCSGMSRTQLALWALLHDATEAYLPDVCRPQKQLMRVYFNERFISFNQMEDNLMRCIAVAFGLSDESIPDEIKTLDMRLLNTEHLQMFDNSIEWGSVQDFPPIDGLEIKCQSPNVAEAAFLETYKYLQGC